MINYDGLYNKNFFGDKLNETHFYDKKLHFQIIKDGTILPHVDVEGVPVGFGGIVDGKGNFVRRSPVHVGISDAYTPNEEVLESPLSVIYIGMLFHVWGHSLTDNLKRIWFLKSKTYKKFFSRLPIVYTPMEGG